MARYRKVDPRMWGDEKFRRLSPIPPCGQGLWVYLLTGPHNNVIPGLFVSGEAGLSERLRWPLEGFREAFQEALREGLLEYDPETLVISIPNAIKYDPPESPNVVKSWRVWIDEVPECELKTKHLQHLEAFLEAYGEAFLKAFRKALPEGFALSRTITRTITREREDLPSTNTESPEPGKSTDPPPMDPGTGQPGPGGGANRTTTGGQGDIKTSSEGSARDKVSPPPVTLGPSGRHSSVHVIDIEDVHKDYAKVLGHPWEFECKVIPTGKYRKGIQTVVKRVGEAECHFLHIGYKDMVDQCKPGTVALRLCYAVDDEGNPNWTKINERIARGHQIKKGTTRPHHTPEPKISREEADRAAKAGLAKVNEILRKGGQR